MLLFLVLALIIAALLVIFAVQNSAVITVTFLSFTTHGSLALILILVFIFGFLAGIFSSLPAFFRRSSALRQERRKVRELEERPAAKQQQPPTGK